MHQKGAINTDTKIENTTPQKEATKPRTMHQNRLKTQDPNRNEDPIHRHQNEATKRSTTHQKRPQNQTPRTEREPQNAAPYTIMGPKTATAHQKRAQDSAPRPKSNPKTPHRTPKASPKNGAISPYEKNRFLGLTSPIYHGNLRYPPKATHHAPKSSPKRRTAHQNRAQQGASRTNSHPKTPHAPGPRPPYPTGLGLDSPRPAPILLSLLDLVACWPAVPCCCGPQRSTMHPRKLQQGTGH